MNGTDYTDQEALEITTIENVVYMGMYNDVSCIIDNNMALYEHQSIWNPNMPLCGFMYAGKLYDKYVALQDISLYGKKRILLPIPQYYVLYNGIDEAEDRLELRLSDAFADSSVKDKYEWTAVMLNVNYGRKAIRDAIDECIDKEILKDYLLANKSEVVEVLLTEYNEQKTMAQLRKESEQIGEQIGKQIGMDCAQAVIAKLIESDRLDELKQIRTDDKLLYKLAKEFGIEE